ncbi:hypothetical protein ACOSQ2_003024 [Xanthoceras sorbifolium]
MSKAYNRVEWSFLHSMLLKLGFSILWTNKIMDCVTTVSFSVLRNGRPEGVIHPTRGLRQGCPLSPYLFLVCAKGLYAFLHQAESCGSIAGIKCRRSSPRISHLFFADDSLLFTRANDSDCLALKGLFENYLNASGQLINLQKLAVAFSSQVSPSQRNYLVGRLGVSVVPCHTRYLGLPCFAGKNRSRLFASIKDKIVQCFRG